MTRINVAHYICFAKKNRHALLIDCKHFNENLMKLYAVIKKVIKCYFSRTIKARFGYIVNNKQSSFRLAAS